MIEIIRHLLGLCGETHPSLIWGGLVGGSGIFYYFYHNIKWCFKKGCSMCSKKIKNMIKF